jgi:glycosyltransferase involved in cell wall biosynthesis
MTILVDATTGQHARGIGIVIDGVLSELPTLNAAAIVATGPESLEASDLSVRRVRFARTRVGRLTYQRLCLPAHVQKLRGAGVPIDRVLLLDAYMPVLQPHRSIRYAAYVHDVLPLTNPELWPLSKLLVKRAAFSSLRRFRPTVFTSTEYNAHQIKRLLGLSARVVPFGCGQLHDGQADEALRAPLADGKPYLIYIGALEPRKNLDVVVEALALGVLDIGDLDLIVVGTGDSSYISKLKRQISAERLQQRVRFYSELPRESALSLVATASALVFPSRAEGFGLPILEALALGTPVVASGIPAVRDWAGDAVLYASPDEPADWVGRILDAVASSPSRRRRGQAFARSFRWRACTEQLLNFR